MKNKNVYIKVAIIIGIIIIIALIIIGNKKQSNSIGTNNQSNTSVVSTDPQDIVPGTYKNFINNVSTTPGLSILSGLVENNVDSNNKTTDDHLELALKNSSIKDMTDFEVYYTVKDLTTNKSEGYYKKLTGLVLKAGETQSIHFDGKSGVNHFVINTNSMYFTSVNQLQFDIQVSTPGYQIATIQIKKDAGGAEVKD